VSQPVKGWYGPADMTGGGSPSPRGDADVWGIISTLLAGPLLWGGIGLGIDALLDSSRRWYTALGLVVGFVASFYIVYMRYGRNHSDDATKEDDQ
jgi:F0F1-type ATP synthase assembly protein I